MLALFLATLVAQTSLAITEWPDGRTGEAHRYTLRCDPVGGTLPKRAAACAGLARLGEDAFQRVPDNVVCTDQYGGPADALVVGTFDGRRVWARFRRRDGCEIARWNRHSFLFPIAAGA